MNKPVYVGRSILELRKILIYEFWYDSPKPKHDEKVKMCFMTTDSLVAYIKLDNNYKDIAEDVETKFYTSDYKLDRPLPKRKYKKLLD